MKHSNNPIAIIVFSFLIAIGSLKGQACKLTLDKHTNQPMLLGVTTRASLQDSNFAWWFNANYHLYTLDSLTLNKIKGDIKNYKIEIVMGTWCSDSRREVPRMFKILDYLNYPQKEVKLVMVNRNMKGLDDETKGLGISRVPTIIFLKGGKEAGRITESPKTTLEKDMLNILKKR